MAGSCRSGRRETRQRISTPLECSGPPSSTSRSMSTTSPRPSRTCAVMRLGLPKARPPRLITESPLTWPTCFAVGFDADRLAADFFLQAPIDAVAAAELGIDRRLHFGRADHVLAGVDGKLVGLLQQIDDRRAARPTAGRHRRPAGPPARSRGRRRRGRTARSFSRRATAAMKPGVEQGRFRRALDPVVEIGRDLEQLREIVVDRR